MRKGEPGYPLVGSMHKFSDGYGIGARYLTSRNQPTFPATIPQHRHVPPPEEFLIKSTCTKLIQDDDRALRRNADQIDSTQYEHNTLRQADSKATISLYDVDKSFQNTKNPIPLSHRSQSNNTAREFTARPDDTLTSREKSKYLSTLSHLDGAFDKFSQRDLLAASLPARAEVEQRRCVITNYHCAQTSGDWGRSLRRGRGSGAPAATAGGGGDER
eukprot:gene32365-41932_t